MGRGDEGLTQRSWRSDSPQMLGWSIGFAMAFMLAHWLTMLLSPFFDVVTGKISLLYLPAFIRVVSIVVAGTAGVVGIAAGSALMGVLHHGDSVSFALSEALAAAVAILLAHWLLCQAMRTRQLPITLWSLIALTAIYCTLNAVIHGTIWGLLDPVFEISPWKLALMMLGDLLGVIVMFGLLRVFVRTVRQFKAFKN
jgi:hypothetical protein